MTKAQFKAALTSWVLAIELKIDASTPYESLEDLARQFDERITNRFDLDRVAECFDWDVVIKLLEEVNSAPNS